MLRLFMSTLPRQYLLVRRNHRAVLLRSTERLTRFSDRCGDLARFEADAPLAVGCPMTFYDGDS